MPEFGESPVRPGPCFHVLVAGTPPEDAFPPRQLHVVGIVCWIIDCQLRVLDARCVRRQVAQGDFRLEWIVDPLRDIVSGEIVLRQQAVIDGNCQRQSAHEGLGHRCCVVSFVDGASLAYNAQRRGCRGVARAGPEWSARRGRTRPRSATPHRDLRWPVQRWARTGFGVLRLG